MDSPFRPVDLSVEPLPSGEGFRLTLDVVHDSPEVSEAEPMRSYDLILDTPSGVISQLVQAHTYELDDDGHAFFYRNGRECASFLHVNWVQEIEEQKPAPAPAANRPLSSEEQARLTEALGEPVVPASAVREALEELLDLARGISREEMGLARRRSFQVALRPAGGGERRESRTVFVRMAEIGPLMAELYADAVEAVTARTDEPVRIDELERWWRSPRNTTIDPDAGPVPFIEEITEDQQRAEAGMPVQDGPSFEKPFTSLDELDELDKKPWGWDGSEVEPDRC
jgi:hypothetical protein